MKHKRLVCYIAVAMIMVLLMSLGVGFAGNNQDKLNSLNSQIKTLQGQLKAGKTQEKKLESQISSIDKLIKEAEGEIQGIQGEITVTNNKIADAQTKLNAMKKDIEQQNNEMSERIRAMYKNGDVGILEVLLGSETIADFMTNLDMAARIFDNDVKVLEKLEEQHKVLEQYSKNLERLQSQLEAKKQEKASKQSELAVSRGNASQLKAEVSQENKSLASQVDALNREANAISAEVVRLQSKNTTYSGGQMAWPVPASNRITSQFGNRYHPVLKVNKLHTGIDIGVGSGNSVVAANAGKVIKAAWNNSYGNMVMIDHGGGIVTLYAHNSSLRVSTGDTVSRGQVIALSGNTGMSTGPHLHFEVRVNGAYKNPLSYL